MENGERAGRDRAFWPPPRARFWDVWGHVQLTAGFRSSDEAACVLRQAGDLPGSRRRTGQPRSAAAQ